MNSPRRNPKLRHLYPERDIENFVQSNWDADKLTVSKTVSILNISQETAVFTHRCIREGHLDYITKHDLAAFLMDIWGEDNTTLNLQDRKRLWLQNKGWVQVDWAGRNYRWVLTTRNLEGKLKFPVVMTIKGALNFQIQEDALEITHGRT